MQAATYLNLSMVERVGSTAQLLKIRSGIIFGIFGFDNVVRFKTRVASRGATSCFACCGQLWARMVDHSCTHYNLECLCICRVTTRAFSVNL